MAAKKETKEEARLLTLLQKEKTKVRKLQKENRELKVEIQKLESIPAVVDQRIYEAEDAVEQAELEKNSTDIDTKGESTTEHDPEEVEEQVPPTGTQI